MILDNFFYLQQVQKWTKPGDCQVKEHEYFVSSHPGEDRDTDSEDEKEQDEEEEEKQLPVPIQDEPLDEEMKETEEVRDTGEVENDE